MTTVPTPTERKAAYESLFVAAFRLGFAQARPDRHTPQVTERRARLLTEAVNWYSIRSRSPQDIFAPANVINRGTRGRFLTLAAEFSRACIGKDKDKARRMAIEMYEATNQLHSEAKVRRKLKRRRRKEVEWRAAKKNSEAPLQPGGKRIGSALVELDFGNIIQ